MEANTEQYTLVRLLSAPQTAGITRRRMTRRTAPARIEAWLSEALMKILVISGSLRAASLNTLLLRATARLAPAGVDVALYPGLGSLALFNPDIEASDPPP